MPSIPNTQMRGYPLIALFLVLTACGVVAALIAPAVRAIFDGRVGAREAGMASVISAISVMILGAIIGIFHYHRGRGLLWGIIVGAIIGLFVGPMVLAPRNAIGTMLGLSLGGAAVIVLFAAAFRLSSRSTTR